MTQQDLEPIIIGCKKGDQACFAQIVDLYGKRCFGYFYRLTGNREISEDMLSLLFVKLVEKIGSFKGGSFESWLFKTASNIFYDYLRDKQRQKKSFEVLKEEFEPAAGLSKLKAMHDEEMASEDSPEIELAGRTGTTVSANPEALTK